MNFEHMTTHSLRFKGGPTDYEQAQLDSMKKQEEIQAKMEGVDQEFYALRKNNQKLYEEQFRPLEEEMLARAKGPAVEATSAEARAKEYEVADEAARGAMERRNARFGITNQSNVADNDDALIRAIALTATGNQSKKSALETQGKLESAAMGVGVGVNQDIGRSYGNAVGGLQRGLGHADAAFQNFGNAQQHMNNAYLAEQQGYSAIAQGASSVAQIGISNTYANRTANYQDPNGESSWGPSWLSGGGRK